MAGAVHRPSEASSLVVAAEEGICCLLLIVFPLIDSRLPVYLFSRLQASERRSDGGKTSLAHLGDDPRGIDRPCCIYRNGFNVMVSRAKVFLRDCWCLFDALVVALTLLSWSFLLLRGT